MLLVTSGETSLEANMSVNSDACQFLPCLLFVVVLWLDP